MTQTKDPVIRTSPTLSDLNLNGHIFGGWVLSQMDIAGGITAGRLARGKVATVAIEGMKFFKPILVGDVVSVYADITKVGRTSITIEMEVIASRGRSQKQVRVTEGTYIYVAIDDNANPRPVDPDKGEVSV